MTNKIVEVSDITRTKQDSKEPVITIKMKRKDMLNVAILAVSIYFWILILHNTPNEQRLLLVLLIVILAISLYILGAAFYWFIAYIHRQMIGKRRMTRGED